MAVVTVPAPPTLWRVGRGDNPLLIRPPDPLDIPGGSRAGSRFDSATGGYGTLYFGTDLVACFGETLARLRPKPGLADLVRDEWRAMHCMELGSVPTDWRERRTAVEVALEPTALFVDVEATETHQVLRRELALGLASLGYDDLDVPTIRGPDRRITRLVSEWVYNQELDTGGYYAGVRYLSRVNSEWECWAVFDDVELTSVSASPIPMDMPALQQVATLFGLTLHGR